MDSITHLALGAVIGEAMSGKSLGKKAMLLGAAAQYCPDGDVLASLWLAPAENLLAHRGITHSFLFVAIASLVFAFAADRWYKRQSIFLNSWVIFFSLQMLVHLFLDSLNAYGAGWLEPFSHLRISFNTIYVADPFYTSWILAGCMALIIIKKNEPSRIQWVLFALIISSVYQTYCIFNKINIDQDVKQILREQNVSYNRYFTTPTPFNNWLWYVVAEDDQGYHVGYRSVFDSQLSMNLNYFPRQDSLLKLPHDQESLQHLKQFSKGYYTIEHKDGKLIFNDLRFGQIAGWHNPRASFAFYFYLEHPEDNVMAMQRGRVAGWNKETFNSLLERIKGN